jgi:hypothetical protein
MYTGNTQEGYANRAFTLTGKRDILESGNNLGDFRHNEGLTA